MSYDPQEPEGVDPRAAERTSTVGVFLLIVGILNALGGFFFLLRGAQALSVTSADLVQVAAQLTPEQKEQFAELARQGWSMERLVAVAGTTLVVVGLLALVAGMITVFAGARMRSLRSYGLAVTGAILAMIPCISPTGCILLGEAIGIWALVVLMSSDVKSSFR
jgi:hypothetical protein